MRHFICTGGCQGESSNPGVCQSEDCKKEGEPLLTCDCADGFHKSEQNEQNDLENKEEQDLP